ncbi:uncharacterized protein LOC128957015 [Oppia nitens]|uniref:uncharacterized protein LOC128957015 n=1 Tax=Oppia nitens TaxID=1686743 RepID=UPI0023D97B23|nr:uncharacterized protein LOC128957015 [Oppia nitens]
MFEPMTQPVVDDDCPLVANDDHDSDQLSQIDFGSDNTLAVIYDSCNSPEAKRATEALFGFTDKDLDVLNDGSRDVMWSSSSSTSSQPLMHITNKSIANGSFGYETSGDSDDCGWPQVAESPPVMDKGAAAADDYVGKALPVAAKKQSIVPDMANDDDDDDSIDVTDTIQSNMDEPRSADNNHKDVVSVNANGLSFLKHTTDSKISDTDCGHNMADDAQNISRKYFKLIMTKVKPLVNYWINDLLLATGALTMKLVKIENIYWTGQDQHFQLASIPNKPTYGLLVPIYNMQLMRQQQNDLANSTLMIVPFKKFTRIDMSTITKPINNLDDLKSITIIHIIGNTTDNANKVKVNVLANQLPKPSIVLESIPGPSGLQNRKIQSNSNRKRSANDMLDMSAPGPSKHRKVSHKQTIVQSIDMPNVNQNTIDTIEGQQQSESVCRLQVVPDVVPDDSDPNVIQLLFDVRRSAIPLNSESAIPVMVADHDQTGRLLVYIPELIIDETYKLSATDAKQCKTGRKKSPGNKRRQTAAASRQTSGQSDDTIDTSSVITLNSTTVSTLICKMDGCNCNNKILRVFIKLDTGARYIKILNFLWHGIDMYFLLNKFNNKFPDHRLLVPIYKRMSDSNCPIIEFTAETKVFIPNYCFDSFVDVVDGQLVDPKGKGGQRMDPDRIVAYVASKKSRLKKNAENDEKELEVRVEEVRLANNVFVFKQMLRQLTDRKTMNQLLVEKLNIN